MEKEIKEHNELIATRVPPGDRWELVADSKKQVHPTLTDTLEVKPEEPKMYSLYGEFRQGI